MTTSPQLDKDQLPPKPNPETNTLYGHHLIHLFHVTPRSPPLPIFEGYHHQTYPHTNSTENIQEAEKPPE